MSAGTGPGAPALEAGRQALWAPTCSASDTTPLALAVELALLGSDLTGFDNSDRQQLRNIARAVMAPGAGLPVALALASEATAARTSIAQQRTRPEATLLIAVQYLLRQAAGSEPSALPGAPAVGAAKGPSAAARP